MIIPLRHKLVDFANRYLPVFFRFIGIGRILGRLLQDHGIGYLYFVGQMNSGQRRDARVAFEKDSAIKVLVSQFLHTFSLSRLPDLSLRWSPSPPEVRH